MVRAPCCSKVGMKRGPWTVKEDTLLLKYIQIHGAGNWRSIANKAGLLRCGKSCRLRWMNYLRPDIKRGNITPDEEDLIIRLHSLLGNRWSLIAGRLPGRTDNEIKNYWNSNIRRRLSENCRNNNGVIDEADQTLKKPLGKIKVHRPKVTRVSVPLLTAKNNHEPMDIEDFFTSLLELPNNKLKNDCTEEEDDLFFSSNYVDQTLENIFNEYQGLLGEEDDHVRESTKAFVDALLI